MTNPRDLPEYVQPAWYVRADRDSWRKRAERAEEQVSKLLAHAEAAERALAEDTATAIRQAQALAAAEARADRLAEALLEIAYTPCGDVEARARAALADATTEPARDRDTEKEER